MLQVQQLELQNTVDATDVLGEKSRALVSPGKMRLYGPPPCPHAGPASQQHHKKTRHFKYIGDTLLPKWPLTTQAGQSSSELTAEWAEPPCLARHQGLPDAVWGLATPRSWRPRGAVARSPSTAVVTQHRTHPASLLLRHPLPPIPKCGVAVWKLQKPKETSSWGSASPANGVPLQDRTNWCKYGGTPCLPGVSSIL